MTSRWRRFRHSAQHGRNPGLNGRCSENGRREEKKVRISESPETVTIGKSQYRSCPWHAAPQSWSRSSSRSKLWLSLARAAVCRGLRTHAPLNSASRARTASCNRRMWRKPRSRRSFGLSRRRGASRRTGTPPRRGRSARLETECLTASGPWTVRRSRDPRSETRATVRPAAERAFSVATGPPEGVLSLKHGSTLTPACIPRGVQ